MVERGEYWSPLSAFVEVVGQRIGTVSVRTEIWQEVQVDSSEARRA